jgi:hypothetical protein
MTPIRTLLLVAAILSGLYAAFNAYETTVIAEHGERQVLQFEAYRKELKELESGAPSKYGYDPRARSSDLRAWLAREGEDRERSAASVRGAVTHAGVALLLAAVLAGTFVYVGRSPGSPIAQRIAKIRPVTVLASLFAVIALLVMVVFVGETLRQKENVERTEVRLVDAERALKDTKFDASGNVSPRDRSAFEMQLQGLERDTQSLVQQREHFRLSGIIAVASLAAAVGLGFVAYRSARRGLPSTGR